MARYDEHDEETIDSADSTDNSSQRCCHVCGMDYGYECLSDCDCTVCDDSDEDFDEIDLDDTSDESSDDDDGDLDPIDDDELIGLGEDLLCEIQALGRIYRCAGDPIEESDTDGDDALQ